MLCGCLVVFVCLFLCFKWKVVTGSCGRNGAAFSSWRGWEGRQHPCYLHIPVDGVVTRLIFPFQSSRGNFLGLLSEVGKFIFLDVSEVLI